MEDLTMTMLKFSKLSYLASTCEGLRHQVVAGNTEACGARFKFVNVQSSMMSFFPEVHKSSSGIVGATSQISSRIIYRFFCYQAEPYTFLYSLSWFKLLPFWPPGVITKDPNRCAQIKTLACFPMGALLNGVHVLNQNDHSQQASQFNMKYKLALQSPYDCGIAEPLICEGLFTTTRAIKHRPPDKHYNVIAGEQLAPHARRSMYIGQRGGLPDRNSESSLIGIGLAPGLRTLYNGPPGTIQTMAALKPLYDCGIAEPLICEGLFTTTRAIKHRPPDKHYNVIVGEQLAPHARRSMYIGQRGGLPDRNSESSLIGIGLAPGLRTLYNGPPGTIQTKAVLKPLYDCGIAEPLICEGLFTTTRAINHRPPDKHYNVIAGEQLAPHARGSMYIGQRGGLPDRNSESSLIGIGLAPGLRTLYNGPPGAIQTKAVPKPLHNCRIAESLTCMVLPTTRMKKNRVPIMLVKNTQGVHLASYARTATSRGSSRSAIGHRSVACSSGVSLVPNRCTNFL
jgi:hypothetical protein